MMGIDDDIRSYDEFRALALELVPNVKLGTGSFFRFAGAAASTRF